MNISYNWLKDFVCFDLTAEEVGNALTSVGLEVGSVEEVQSIKGGLKGLVVGEVLTCEAHPNSDHLHVCSVDVGEGSPLQIVCGAPNVAAGQKVIVATIGTVLYDGDDSFTIKRSKLRGVESNGMICGENEIGVGRDTSGIIVLPPDTRVGMPAAEYYKLESDYLIEIDITPNRADACSHYGVARDLYAWLLANGRASAIKKDSVEAFAADNNSLNIPIEVINTEACPRYCAVTISNCKVQESPDWLQNRLRAIGVRPINNVVDVTNYILFAYGQPLHCFDADMIKGGMVQVRTMPEDTPFVSLDGEERKLSENDLVICHAEEPMCIAGVFGGKGSGTYDSTSNILLESAYFHPAWVRKTARRHGLNTDASFRFERGIDPNGQIYALKLAALLIKELAGGEISMDIYDSNPTEVACFPVELNLQYATDLIGKKIETDTIKRILESLEINIVGETSESLSLEVPPYRVDVTRPCDVVEDILRIYGYNNVEMTISVKSNINIKGEADRSNELQNTISEQLIGGGYHEILNNSLTSASYYTELSAYPGANCVQLINPLSNDLSVMRQTLLMGGLESVARNVNRRATNLRLFEFGNCYRYTEEKKSSEDILAPYSENCRLGLWLTGKRVEGSWMHADEDNTVFDLKAHIVNILHRLGINIHSLKVSNGDNDVFASSLVYSDHKNNTLVEFGIVSASLLKQFQISVPVYFAEFNWELLMSMSASTIVRFKELSKFPSVSRDLALLVNKDVAFADIEKVVVDSEKKLLKRVELFDVYEGKNIEAGKKSYAINCLLQDDEKTLTDKQIDKIMQNIISNLEKKLAAKLR